MKHSLFKAVMWLDQVFRWVEILLIASSTIIMGVVLGGNFISRNLLGSSWLFSEEVGSFMLIIQCSAGMAYCARMGRHIRMSAVFDLLPQKGKRAVMIFICLLTALALGYLGYLGILWVLRTQASGKVSSVLRFPMWIVYSVIPLGCFLSAVQYVITFLKNIMDSKTIWVGSAATDLEADGKEAFEP